MSVEFEEFLSNVHARLIARRNAPGLHDALARAIEGTAPPRTVALLWGLHAQLFEWNVDDAYTIIYDTLFDIADGLELHDLEHVLTGSPEISAAATDIAIFVSQARPIDPLQRSCSRGIDELTR